MNRFEGKRVVITGGTTGIGYAAAERMVLEGAQVLITGQNPERVRQAADALGSRAFGLVADQTTLDGIACLADAVREKFGQADVLFLNAGVTMPAAMEDETEELFDRQMAINLKAPFFIMKSLAPLMCDGGSVIVNTSCLTLVQNRK